ncbi:MAG: hypothetical protein KTR21_05180 [Rhodobacteraceae bacterium]|nr:hypothetical protein [Paracoccaceae bacterium]
MSDSGPTKRETFHIENDEAQDLTILLEPWGQELSLAPGISVDVVFEGSLGISGNLSISRKQQTLVVRVRHEGVAFFRVSAPELREEMREAS